MPAKFLPLADERYVNAGDGEVTVFDLRVPNGELWTPRVVIIDRTGPPIGPTHQPQSNIQCRAYYSPSGYSSWIALDEFDTGASMVRYEPAVSLWGGGDHVMLTLQTTEKILIRTLVLITIDTGVTVIPKPTPPPPQPNIASIDPATIIKGATPLRTFTLTGTNFSALGTTANAVILRPNGTTQSRTATIVSATSATFQYDNYTLLGDYPVHLVHLSDTNIFSNTVIFSVVP